MPAGTLESRKIIERAKGMLMREMKPYPEMKLTKRYTKKAWTWRKTMKEIAEAVILASDMGKRPDKGVGKVYFFIQRCAFLAGLAVR